jgi:hypothetical protein
MCPWLGAKLRFVHEPSLLQLGADRFSFTGDPGGGPLRRFAIVELFRFRGGSLGSCFQRFLDTDQPEDGSVRRAIEIEAVRSSCHWATTVSGLIHTIQLEYTFVVLLLQAAETPA